MITLNDNTYRTIKNEDYEKLIGLANLHKEVIDEYIKETIDSISKEYYGEFKKLSEKNHEAKMVLLDLVTFNDAVVSTIRREIHIHNTEGYSRFTDFEHLISQLSIDLIKV